MAIKRIPYGISDFRLLSGEDYYYVDKTRFIEEIEKCPNFLFLIRPRRFGKSLWLAMLSAYYDIAAKDQFEEYCSASSISVSTRHPSGTAT